jgi:hypothetical protein
VADRPQTAEDSDGHSAAPSKTTATTSTTPDTGSRRRRGHPEIDLLGGGDPSSVSKAAAERAGHASATSFRRDNLAVATARAMSISGCSRNSIDDMGRECRDLGRRIDFALRVWTLSSTRSSHTLVATLHPARVELAHVR